MVPLFTEKVSPSMILVTGKVLVGMRDAAVIYRCRYLAGDAEGYYFSLNQVFGKYGHLICYRAKPWI